MSGSANTFTNMPAGTITGTLGADHGGTGIANNIASTLAISGSFATTLTVTGITGVTLPTSGTLYGTATGSITSAQLLASLTDETGTGVNVFNNTPTLIAPLLGTPTSGNLANCTALPIDGGTSGTLPVLRGGTGVTASTGTVAVVLSTNPVLVTPNIGTPSAGVLTSCTGLPIDAGTINTLPIARGGTAVTSVTTAPAASSFAGWDANKNLSADSFISGYTTTATGAGTTVLTVDSTELQYFTGATTQTVTLPVVSTLVLGQRYEVHNLSSGNVTVQSSGANSIQVMGANSKLELICILITGTSAASWNAVYSSATGGTVTSVAASVPSVFSISGSPVTTSGTLAMTYSGTALPVLNGGTGVTTSTGSGANSLATSPTLTTPVFSGNPSGTIVSGQYTPTYANIVNVSAFAANVASYIRVGSYVTVFFSVNTTATAAAPTATSFTMTLPIASDIGTAFDLVGTWMRDLGTTSIDEGGIIYGVAAGDLARIDYTATSASNKTGMGQFMYQII